MSPPNESFLLHEPNAKLFFSRGDLDDPRLGEIAQRLSSQPTLSDALQAIEKAIEKAEKKAEKKEGQPHPICIAGYPDDEGIRINGGRLGAALGPDEIRRALYKMTPRLGSILRPSLIDVGNLDVVDQDLATRHDSASAVALKALHSGARWIGLGGGHDYGFAEGTAFCEWVKSSEPKGTRPLIINFDAHLDVRPTTSGLSSGTPFYRLLEAHSDLDLVEVGIQPQCNSQRHAEWARSRGAMIITQEELSTATSSLTSSLAYFKNRVQHLLTPDRSVFLSVDIDGFSSAVAPGCSQSWATGMMPDEFFALFTFLLENLNVQVLGIYEVSPPLDQDLRTAKLAAQIAHRYIYS